MLLTIILWLVGVIAVLFILSLLVYFFNLDMKLSSKLIPFMNRHYNKVKRNTKL